MSRARQTALAGVLILILAAATLVARLPALSQWLSDAVAFSLDDRNHWALFLVIQICVAAIGFLPASLMAIGAGATYGLGYGLLISSIGLMIGGWLSFLLSRSVFRPWIERWLNGHPRFRRLEEAVDADGWRFVCLLRMSPVMPFALTSYGLGLTGVTHRAFALGTLASLPSLACYVAMGALGHASWGMGSGNSSYLNSFLLAIGAVATILVALRIRKFIAKALKD
ncbi:MAG: VTT domain-containing protein [Sphingobium sp.]